MGDRYATNPDVYRRLIHDMCRNIEDMFEQHIRQVGNAKKILPTSQYDGLRHPRITKYRVGLNATNMRSFLKGGYQHVRHVISLHQLTSVVYFISHY